MSRSEVTPSHHQATGVHRAGGRARRRGPADPLSGQPAAAYEPYLDGLFTYCLSVLCEHDAAVAALGDTLAVAERAHHRLRDPRLRRPWLYAIARWACLLRFTDGRPVAFRATPALADAAAGERRRQLAALAWPEAAGTTPEQREAIELAVRHQLTDTEIAAVLRLEPEAARTLLSRAACEVERTRTALLVVRAGRCPDVDRVAADTHLLLSTTLRRELVRHVDECPACRRTAEQAVAPGPWPGTTAPAVLAVLTAPREAAHAAMTRSARALRAGARDRHGTPRHPVPHFDRRGFPVDGKERAARRALIRHRAVTTTVVAAVVAAPALALWAAYRPAPASGAPQGPRSVSAPDAEGDDYAYVKTGTRSVAPGRSASGPRSAPASGVPTPSATDASASPAPSAPAAPGSPDPSASVPPGTPTPSGDPHDGGSPSAPPGWITVRAAASGDVTAITVVAHGGSPVRWSVSCDAPWLRLSRTSGTLRPGEAVTVLVRVAHAREPAGPWNGRVVFTPSGAPVTIQGQGPIPPPATSPPPLPGRAPVPIPT
ncbi:sigma-70 family RNA polymerase sigma factor [Streptomyces sp. SL13]|uniref:Sigma-70 family RNA polymerase sigma factor n=1 Tax=Streptantibioticus silvisoli TaxID=2705255 RepID=A0AA90KG43_9ACTN|nr:sigma-70 family RNA polymerase sigma factor [Streptantibioticus silvisoli]MDI5969674.1 sigma-70 family RNA polymerase sigma factor [Streptantibioticus silvisoli]